MSTIILHLWNAFAARAKPKRRIIATICLALILAGCTGLPGPDNDATEKPAPEITKPKPGATRIAMLLPLTASGNAGQVAKALKEAGELALFDTKSPNFVLISKDTGGTIAGAQAAAIQAVNEGAELIIGPLFSGSVRGAAPVAQSRNIPMIAFSTDRTVAGRGTYLLSFLPSQDVERIVDYAVKRRITRFAALIPRSAYGNVVATAFRKAVRARRGRIVAMERYTRNVQGVAAPVKKIIRATKRRRSRAQAIFIPESGQILRAIGNALAANKVSKRIRLLGTGLWDEPNIGTATALSGGWFAAPTPSAKQSFVNRFRTTYNRQPPRIASLAYDAVTLAVALSGNLPKGQKYTPERLATRDGFAGVDGLFRLTPQGINQRGLAILQVTPTGARVIDAAPVAFGKNSPAF